MRYQIGGEQPQRPHGLDGYPLNVIDYCGAERGSVWFKSQRMLAETLHYGMANWTDPEATLRFRVMRLLSDECHYRGPGT